MLDLAQFAINHGAHVERLDATGLLPLHVASMKGAADLVELLIARGARVNAHATNSARTTGLHLAAQDGRVNATKALLRLGANVDERDAAGDTPLGLAVKAGNADVCEVLLSAGARANSANLHGETPVSMAATQSRSNIGRLLLLHRDNSRPHAKDGASRA